MLSGFELYPRWVPLFIDWRSKKSNKHIANGYKKLVHTFKREAVQFFVAKNLAVNHLPLEALPAVQT